MDTTRLKQTEEEDDDDAVVGDDDYDEDGDDDKDDDEDEDDESCVKGRRHCEGCGGLLLLLFSQRVAAKAGEQDGWLMLQARPTTLVPSLVKVRCTT